MSKFQEGKAILGKGSKIKGKQSLRNGRNGIIRELGEGT